MLIALVIQFLHSTLSLSSAHFTVYLYVTSVGSLEHFFFGNGVKASQTEKKKE